jgi:hypothetical protein
MNSCSEPIQGVKVGDVIGMDLIPDALWTGPVLEVRECETNGGRQIPHSSFRVLDPEGIEDWLCAYDAHKA